MRNITYIFLVTALCLFFSGCQEPQKKTNPVALEGLKIGDLLPENAEELPPLISFKVFTFHIPQKDYHHMSKAFNILLKEPLHFSNYNAFKANGFDVGYGRNDLWSYVGNNLQNVNAKRVEVNHMIIYDQDGNDIFSSKLNGNASVRYSANDGSETIAKLSNGSFIWRIKAKPLAQRRGAAQIRIQGHFINGYGKFTSSLPGNKFNPQFLFKPTGMILKMDEGDFILLGPSPEKNYSALQLDSDLEDSSIDQGNLASWFFNLRGTVNVAKPPLEDADPSAEIIYERKHNVPLVKVYLIACMGVGN